MTTRRGTCALLGVALGLVAAATAMLSSTGVRAVTEGPDAQGWWSITNQGVGVDPGVPPDVAATDLYVAGLAGDKQVPVAVPAPFPTGIGARGATAAIAALRFTIPPGASIDKLTLKFAGTAPPAADILACRTTEAFIPERDGPWNDVPAYDCSVSSVATVPSGGGTLEFSDIGALRNGSTLSFVIVPQYADRIVLAKPDINALSMRAPNPAFGSGSAATAPTTQPEPQPVSSFSAPATSGTAGGAVSLPVAPPALHAPATTPAPAQAPPSQQGQAAAQPGPSTTAAQPVVASAPGIDDARARLAASLFLAAALLAFLALAASDAAWLARLLGLRAARLAEATAPRPRGVGRFARPRDGRPDAL